MFVNRGSELEALSRWWSGTAEISLALVYGRRRVGKTALLEEFARSHTAIFHTGAARPVLDELGVLSRIGSAVLEPDLRDLDARPFADWDDAFETFASAARERPLLLVLDEFPELVAVTPGLPSLMRAFLDRARGKTKLKILLCGSAVRTMEAAQTEREPLYGRIELSLLLHPFQPYEAAEMLTRLDPSTRALVWGIAGGVPLYLDWWDQTQSVRQNLKRLVCSPGGQLLNEGQLVLATEGDLGDLGHLVLRAIAAGRTRHNEIEQAVRTEPGRALDRLIELRLIERLVPVTERPDRTRRRTYRIADNFLAFWLGVVEPYRTEIERGMGNSILPVIMERLDDHMGGRWEAAVRDHLRRLADEGRLGGEIVRVGPYWTDSPPVEIDAVGLARRSETARVIGEAKWAKRVRGDRLRRELERKSVVLPKLADDPTYVIAAREEVENADAVMPITAADIFSA